MTATDLKARLDRCKQAVEATLEQIFDEIAQSEHHAAPQRLIAAMRHATISGGKCFRPLLLMESARLFGVSQHQVVRSAAALECVHCYSLVHDDLPAMDDDDMRRGRASLHKAFDEATAILAGDALLTLAFEIMADGRTHGDPAVRALLCAKLAQAAGASGMVGGQARDMAAEDAVLNAAQIARLQGMKTGALITFACEAGAIIGGASQAQRTALVNYGEAVGLAFQLCDDLLDVEASADSLGKATGKDKARGKQTLVSLYGVDVARQRLLDIIITAQNSLASFGEHGHVLGAAAQFIATRSARV